MRASSDVPLPIPVPGTLLSACLMCRECCRHLSLSDGRSRAFRDPMNLVEYDQFSAGEEATIGFLRQAEIKHGRVAMAAFVGYIVQSNGIHFPWKLTGAHLHAAPQLPLPISPTPLIAVGKCSSRGGLVACSSGPGLHPLLLCAGEISYADIAAAGSPPDQWDALPSAAKVQILCFIGLLEVFSESTTILALSDNKHYMSGGKPGACAPQPF